MQKGRFKNVAFFEADLYIGMLKDSSKFLTKAWNIVNRDEDILLDI